MLLLIIVGGFILLKTHFIIVLVLLTFVGQAFASVILPCQMQMNSMTDTNIAATSSSCHNTSELSNAMQLEMDTSDCCDTTCHCPAGSCQSVGISMVLPLLKLEKKLIEFFLMPPSQLMSQHKSSLYRPPMFA